MSYRRSNSRHGAAALLCLTLVLAMGAPRAQEVEPLVLRLNDAVALPGGIAALTLRTYSSRGIGQGQIGMAVRDPGGNPVPNPVESVIGAYVFNVGDGGAFSIDIDLTGPDPVLLLSFDSPAGSVNLRDGPLAVIYLRLSDTLLPGQQFNVQLNLADTVLDDPDGAPIPFELRSGRLDVSAVGAPFQLAAAAEPAAPGTVAFLSVQTSQLRLLSGGHVVFRYDPAIAAGPPIVYVDRRYGSAVVDRSGSVPAAGIVSVQFVSPADNLNRVVGDIITIRLPVLDTIPAGTSSPIWLDPSQTFLVDGSGQVLTLDFEADLIRFR